MTRVILTCTSWNRNKLLGYVRDIETAHIPGVKAIVDLTVTDPDDGMVQLEIETLDALIAVKQALGIQLIIGGGTDDHKDYTIEVYDDWRE